MAVTIAKTGTVKLVTWTWTSDASGDASEATAVAVDGDVIGLVTVPSSGSAPTDDYDIVINDANSVDVLAGAGANRDTANTEYVQGTSLGWVANSLLTLVVSNAGNTKAGTVYLYIR